jgi:hypothetical protein
MKKILVSITLVCYLAVSCGVVINFHYCMNRLASIQLFASEKQVCDKCGMATKRSHGCCRDEVTVIKMKDDQQKAQPAYSLQAPDQIISVPSVFIIIPTYNVDESGHGQNHSPPLLTGQDICLQNCVFRI